MRSLSSHRNNQELVDVSADINRIRTQIYNSPPLQQQPNERVKEFGSRVKTLKRRLEEQYPSFDFNLICMTIFRLGMSSTRAKTYFDIMYPGDTSDLDSTVSAAARYDPDDATYKSEVILVSEICHVCKVIPDQYARQLAEAPEKKLFFEVLKRVKGSDREVFSRHESNIMSLMTGDMRIRQGDSLDAFVARIAQLVRVLDHRNSTIDFSDVAYNAFVHGLRSADVRAGVELLDSSQDLERMHRVAKQIIAGDCYEAFFDVIDEVIELLESNFRFRGRRGTVQLKRLMTAFMSSQEEERESLDVQIRKCLEALTDTDVVDADATDVTLKAAGTGKEARKQLEEELTRFYRQCKFCARRMRKQRSDETLERFNEATQREFNEKLRERHTRYSFDVFVNSVFVYGLKEKYAHIRACIFNNFWKEFEVIFFCFFLFY